MKTKLTLMGIAASLGAMISVNAQSGTSAAVGFQSQDLTGGGVFNVMGVNLGNPVAAAGDFEAAGQDDDADFIATLQTVSAAPGVPDFPYTVQNIDTGDFASVDNVDSATNITTTLPAPTAGDRYEIRQAQSIGDLFGAGNEAGFQEGDDTTADVLWVPKGDGTYDRIYRNNVTQAFPPLNPGWRFVGGGDADAAGHIVPFQFGVFAQVRGPDLSLTFVGHVRGDDDVDDGHGARTTNVPLTGDGTFNVVNRIVPVGITVADSAIALLAGDDTTGDVLWNPLGDGTYNRVYNNNVTQAFPPLNPGLRYIGQGDTDAAGEVLNSGFLIQRRDAGAGTAAVTVPDSLDL